MQDSISKVLLSATLLGLSVATVQADCQPASSQACINMKNAEEAYKREQKENEKKRMDEYAKRAGNNANHDNRLKTGKDTSVGVSYPPGVNFKKTW